MKPLETTYTRRGFTHRQIHREGDLAIFEQSKPGITRWEVFEVQRNPGRVIAGVATAASESPPGDAQWGRPGFTCVTREDAYRRFDRMNESGLGDTNGFELLGEEKLAK